MLAALATAFVAYAPAHVARGICSGSGRFRSYAVIIGSDGVVRIFACIVLAVIGITSTAPYAFAVALSPLVAVIAVGSRGQLRTDPGPTAPWNEVTQNLGWLLVGAVFTGVFVSFDLARIVSTLFILSMFALIGSLALLLREVFLAVKVGRHDILVRDVLR